MILDFYIPAPHDDRTLNEFSDSISRREQEIEELGRGRLTDADRLLLSSERSLISLSWFRLGRMRHENLVAARTILRDRVNKINLSCAIGCFIANFIYICISCPSTSRGPVVSWTTDATSGTWRMTYSTNLIVRWLLI